MDEIKEAESLLIEKKYKEASHMLQKILAKGGNEKAYFLKGILSLKLKNYKVAQEYFSRAIEMKPKAEYHHMKGLSHFEIFEMEDAEKEFLNVIGKNKKDAEAHFFLALSYMFMDDPRGEEYLKAALDIDSRKTKALLKNFFLAFISKDPDATETRKKRILERIMAL